MPRLLIVDDSAVVRRTIRAFLQAADPSWQICGEATSADEGFDLCVVLQPDVALIDMALTSESGLSLVTRLREGARDTRIVVMSEQTSSVLGIIAKTYGVATIQKSNLASRLTSVLGEVLRDHGD